MCVREIEKANRFLEQHQLPALTTMIANIEDIDKRQ